MDYELSPIEQAIKTTAQEFAAKEARPGAPARDAAHAFPYELYRRCGELGLTGIAFPEAYGGSDCGWFPFILALEELARVDGALAAAVQGSAAVAAILNALGTPEQKQRWLAPLVRGAHVGAFGLTEPDAGSDNQAMRTSARLENGQWVLNGNKVFITNAGTDITLFVIVFCVTGVRPDGRKEFSSILVPNGTPGYIIEPAHQKLGVRASDTRPLTFVDCRVPASHLVGEAGGGLRNALGALQLGRLFVATMALGLAQGCLDECLRYAGDRVAFGRPIGAFQAIQHQLADMATEIVAARLLIYHAARLYDAGRLPTALASQAKLFASEVAQRAAVAACDLFGGMGFMEETPVTRYYRDVKSTTIADGTSNVQRTLIARSLGLPKE